MPVKILPAGVMRAIHVYVPRLHERLSGGNNLPVWAIRSSLYDYGYKMLMARRFEVLGPVEGKEHFDRPLPGTKGRGVALVYTKAALKVYYDGDEPEFLDVEPDEVPAARPDPKPARPDPKPKTDQVWYTTRRGERGRYKLLGYSGKFARLEHHSGEYAFKVAADRVVPV